MLNFFRALAHLTKSLIHEKTNAFVAGCFGGGFFSINFLFADIPASTPLIGYVVKVSGAVLIAFCTGIASALGKEYVDYRKEQRKIKKKKEAGKKFNEEYGKDIYRKNGTHD